MSQEASIRLTASDETQAAFRAVNYALSNLGNQATQMQNKAVSAFKGIAIAAAGLGSVSSMVGFLDGIHKSIEGLGDLKESAERTGASVEKLSALKGVAKTGGRDFADIEVGITRLNKALHGTDDESKGAGKALAAMGLDLQKLRDMDPADAMLELAKAQENFADGGGKSAAMMAILGKNGAALIPYLHDLAETQQLVGKVSAQQAKDADEYAKNIKRLEASWGNLSRQMGSVVVGPAKDITDWMVKAQNEGGALNAILVGIGMSLGALGGLEINPLKRAEAQVNEAFASVVSLRKQIDSAPSSRKGWFGESIAIDNTDLREQLNSAEAVLRNAIKRRDRLVKAAVDADKPKDTSLNSQSFGKDPEDKNGSKKSDEAATLIARLNEQIGVQQQALLATDKTTAAEKEAMTVMIKLRDGTLEATVAQKQAIATRLENLLVLDKEVGAHQAYLKALDDQVEANKKNRDAMWSSLLTTQKSIETYGLSEVQISSNIKARLEEAIAIAQQNGASESQIAYLQEELALREKLTDALDTLDTKRLMSNTDTGKAQDQHVKIDELRRKMQEGKISETEYDEAVNSLVNKSKDAFDAMDEFAKSAAHNMESAMADFFINPTKNGLSGLASSFGQTVQKMIAEAGSAQLMKSLFGTMGQATSGGGAGNWGWVGQAATWIGSFFEDGGIMTDKGPLPLRKYATGGVANSPQLAMFGEGRMPEAYVPLPDGRNIPVKVNGGAGTTIHQTIYAGQGTDTAQVRRSAAAGARAALGVMNGAQRYG